MAGARKGLSQQARLLILLAVALVLVGAYFGLRLIGYTAQTSGVTVSPTPQAGNEAKTAQSEPTPTPVPAKAADATATPAANSASYIQYFAVTARGGGQYVATTLSTNAASATCTITLTPTNGAATTQTGTVISTGSSLACDFGGIISVTGNGTAHLVVRGANGNIDTKDTNF